MKGFVRRLSVGFTIGLSSIVFTLLICEIIARMVLPAPLTVEIEKVIRDTPQGNIPPQTNLATAGTQQAIDESLSYLSPQGHRYRPNVSAKIEYDTLGGRPIEYRTNSLGLFDDEIPSRTDPKEKRVLFLGDSITAGVGVPQNERFQALLNDRYLKRASSPVRFINAGISGINAEESFYHYTEIQDKVKPDIVVFDLYLNDANQSGLFLSRIPPYPFSESYLASWLLRTSDELRKRFYLTSDSSHQGKLKWRESFKAGRTFTPAPWLGERIMTSPEAMDYAIYESYLDWGLGWSNVAWAELRQTLRALKSLTDANGQELVLVLFPVSYQVHAPFEDNRPGEYFDSSCKRLGLKCLNLLPELRRRYLEDKRMLYFDQCHYNPEGQQVIADIMELWLIEQGLL